MCLIEARGQGLLRAAREGDELRTGTNMRALLSALASGRAEIERLGKRQGWSVGIIEEMLDRLQSLVPDPLQKGGDLIMSSIPYTWREQASRRIRQAEGVISSVMPAVTTKDWTLQNCQDYLVELEMVTSGAMMALRLTANDIGSDQVSQQVECIGSRAKEARNMALALRQKYLDEKLQIKDRPMQVFVGMQGRVPGPGPGRPRGYDGPQFSGRLEDLRELRRCWGEYERLYYPKDQEDVLVELLHSQALGPELRKAVCHARSLGTTWTYLEDHLREQRERIDHILSSTLKTEHPVGTEDLYRYYRKVCQFLDTPEGRGTVSSHVTMDQLDMRLCMLPSEETFLWGRRGERVHPDDTPNVFYDFCKGRAEELKAQILSPRGMERVTQAPAASPNHLSWQGPCVLGELCGGSHMPEVCQLFEAMTPEGRLAVIQRKQLCQFCFRHPDTQPCPSQSLPACPIRGCMRMHHRMLHRALIREEARPIVLGVELELEEHGAEGNPLTSDSKGAPLLTSDESEGEEPGRPHLCQQMVLVEANGVMHSLHSAYTVRLGIHCDSGEEGVGKEDGAPAGSSGTAVRQGFRRHHGVRHRLSLPTASGCAGEPPSDLCIRGRGDHYCG